MSRLARRDARIASWTKEQRRVWCRRIITWIDEERGFLTNPNPPAWQARAAEIAADYIYGDWMAWRAEEIAEWERTRPEREARYAAFRARQQTAKSGMVQGRLFP